MKYIKGNYNFDILTDANDQQKIVILALENNPNIKNIFMASSMLSVQYYSPQLDKRNSIYAAFGLLYLKNSKFYNLERYTGMCINRK